MSLYHTIEALDERTRERLESMLAESERFVLGVTISDGLYKRHRSRLLLTDEHLLRIRHGYGVHVETERYRLRELSGLEVTENGRAELTITGPEEALVYPLERDAAAEFAMALRRGLAWRSGKP